MPSNKTLQNLAVTDLREAARQLIALIDTIPNRAQRQVLAAQAFELLRQAAQLAQQDEKTQLPEVVATLTRPIKSGA
jgi:hypothetical protein